MTYLGSDRFVVRELGGYAGIFSNWGLTITICDRAYCYATVAQWRTEQLFLGQGAQQNLKFAQMRDRAAARCADLNAAHPF